jgi:sRNA-binding carbon storage regulator CsrA
MLVVALRVGKDSLKIGESTIHVSKKTNGNTIILAIEAPKELKINRIKGENLCEKDQKQNERRWLVLGSTQAQSKKSLNDTGQFRNGSTLNASESDSCPACYFNPCECL